MTKVVSRANQHSTSSSFTKRPTARKVIKARIIRNSLEKFGQTSFDIEYCPTSDKQWSTIKKFSEFF